MKRIYSHPNAKDCNVEVYSVIAFPGFKYARVKLRVVPKRGNHIIPGEFRPRWLRISVRTLALWQVVS